MLLKYFRSNSIYFILFTIIFISLYLLSSTFTMHLDNNSYQDAFSSIQIGDVYLVDANKKTYEYYSEKFDSKLVPAALTNLKIKDREHGNSHVLSTYPIFFIDDSNLAENKVFINSDILSDNLYPEEIYLVTSDFKQVTVEVEYSDYHEEFEVVINSSILDAYGEELITYYAVQVTSENKSNICHYFSYNSNESILAYKGNLIELINNHNMNNEIQLAQLSCLISLTFCFVFVIILFNYINKNSVDINLMRIYGYSRKTLTILMMSIPFVCFIFASIAQFGLCQLLALLYNSIKSNSVQSLWYGINSFKLFGISTILIMIFIFVGCIYFYCVQKRRKINA